MVELKFNLDKETLKTGCEQNFMKRHKKWYAYWLVTGILFVGAGIHFSLNNDGYGFVPYLMIILGIFLLLKKQMYIRKMAKNVLINKPESSEVHCRFSRDDIWIKTIDSEGTVKWTGIYGTIITGKGILVYLQKGIHMWIPKEADLIEGTWGELVEVSSKVSLSKSHLPLQ